MNNTDEKQVQYQHDLLHLCLDLVQKGSYSDLKKILLKNEFLVHYKFPKYNNTTLLHFAAIAGDESIVELLLDISKNVDIDIRNDESWTPLHYSSMNNHCEIVKLLINRGASVNFLLMNGWSSLHLAVCSYTSSINTVKLLIENGNANINVLNHYSQTPLDVLLRSGPSKNTTKDQITRLLLDCGAILNVDINPKHKHENYFMILNIITSYHSTHSTFINKYIEYLPWRKQLLNEFYPNIPNSLIPKCGWSKAKEVTKKYYVNEIFFNLHLHIANEYAKKDSSSNRMYMAGANNKTFTILTILKYYIPQYI